jgi:hypothetical protein
MTRCSAIQPGRCFYSNGGERTFIGARFGCSTARSIATFREWLYRPDRVDNIWTLEHEAAFFKSAPAHLHLPLLLGLWTGQREGDFLRLPWSAYDGKVIRLRPRKTMTKKRAARPNWSERPVRPSLTGVQWRSSLWPSVWGTHGPE